MTERIQSTTLQEEALRYGGYFTPQSIVDFDGNTFTGFVRNGYEESFQAAGVVQRRSPTGALNGEWEILAPNGSKADGLGIYPSGSTLLITITAHGVPGARAILGQAALEGVFAPYPSGVAPGGREGAYVAPAQQQEVEVEIDYARIAETVIQRLKQEMGGELRAVLQEKAQDAIGKSFDPARYDTDPRAKYVQDATAPFFRDRAYEGARAARTP